VAEFTDRVRRFLAANEVGVIATERRDGLPRQSVVHYLFGDDTIIISTVSDAGKVRDVERTGRASYAVMGHARPYPQVVVTGSASIRREGIAEASKRIFTLAFGQPPADLTDEVLAGMGRVLLEIRINRVAGVRFLSESTDFDPEPPG
jgi:PPOX class probable F420-dependent enzyme